MSRRSIIVQQARQSRHISLARSAGRQLAGCIRLLEHRRGAQSIRGQRNVRAPSRFDVDSFADPESVAISFDAGALGMGGLTLWWGESQLESNRPSARFSGAEWTGNAAGSGAAVALLSGQGDASFDRCVMRSNIAYIVSVRIASFVLYVCRLTTSATFRVEARSHSTEHLRTSC